MFSRRSRLFQFFITTTLGTGLISYAIAHERPTISNLEDGFYRFCSDAHPNEEKLDVHRYCFSFTKIGKKIVGDYSYRAPKDTAIICIEGNVDENQVSGKGYELHWGSPEPLTEDDYAHLDEVIDEDKLSYWDEDSRSWFQGGLNLQVNPPKLHYFQPPSDDDPHTSYWDVVRYDIVKLDLTGFEQIASPEILSVEPDYDVECSSKDPD